MADNLIWRGWVSKGKPELLTHCGSHATLLLITSGVEKHLSSLHPAVLLQVSCKAKKKSKLCSDSVKYNLFLLTGPW